jgi:hypothetical protein
VMGVFELSFPVKSDRNALWFSFTVVKDGIIVRGSICSFWSISGYSSSPGYLIPGFWWNLYDAVIDCRYPAAICNWFISTLLQFGSILLFKSMSVIEYLSYYNWEFLSSPPRPDRLWDPPILLSRGCRGCFPGGKAAGSWSWLLTSSFQVKNAWSYTSTPQIYLYGMVLT